MSKKKHTSISAPVARIAGHKQPKKKPVEKDRVEKR